MLCLKQGRLFSTINIPVPLCPSAMILFFILNAVGDIFLIPLIFVGIVLALDVASEFELVNEPDVVVFEDIPFASPRFLKILSFCYSALSRKNNNKK